jgi:hypothetical protein
MLLSQYYFFIAVEDEYEEAYRADIVIYCFLSISPAGLPLLCCILRCLKFYCSRVLDLIRQALQQLLQSRRDRGKMYEIEPG